MKQALSECSFFSIQFFKGLEPKFNRSNSFTHFAPLERDQVQILRYSKYYLPLNFITEKKNIMYLKFEDLKLKVSSFNWPNILYFARLSSNFFNSCLIIMHLGRL